MDSFSLLLHLALIIGTASARTYENESHATMQKDIPDELGTAFRTNETLEMPSVLREIIKYFEFTCLSLVDHPDQAREVRMAANQSKILQLLASDLINKFGVTAAHIEEMMKQIVDPVKMNMKDEELVKDALHQNIEEAGNMKKEAETTRDNYIELKDKLIEIMANVPSRKKHIVDEKERIRVAMEVGKVQMKAANLAQEELNEEIRILDGELEMLKSDRDLWRGQDGTAGQNMTGRSEILFQDMPAGTAFINGFFGTWRFTYAPIKEENISMDPYREAELERAYGQKRIILSRLHEQQKLALEKVAELVKLGKEIANFGPVHSLYYIIDNLGVVEVQLTRIMQFWSRMASVLEELKSNMKTVIPYLKKEDPEHRDRFFAGINRTRKGWSVFRNICASYVKETDKETDKEIGELYSFLSAPIDRWASEKRAERQRQILQEIESYIEATYTNLG